MEDALYGDLVGYEEHIPIDIEREKAKHIQEVAVKGVNRMPVGEVLNRREAAIKRRQEGREKWDIPTAGQFSRGGADALRLNDREDGGKRVG